jgi:hypothetical protein
MITGAWIFSASNIFATSYLEILISAGDPAPSIIMISFSLLRLSKEFKITGNPFCKTNVL